MLIEVNEPEIVDANQNKSEDRLKHKINKSYDFEQKK